MKTWTGKLKLLEILLQMRFSLNTSKEKSRWSSFKSTSADFKAAKVKSMLQIKNADVDLVTWLCNI